MVQSGQDDHQDVVAAVNERVDQAIRDNLQNERVIVGILIALFTTGIGMMVFGAIIQRWELLVPGGLLQLTVFFPIRRLIKLREDKMRLQIIPQLLQLAPTKEAKELAAQLARRLIEQV